jgi:hypothetical protein
LKNFIHEKKTAIKIDPDKKYLAEDLEDVISIQELQEIAQKTLEKYLVKGEKKGGSE